MAVTRAAFVAAFPEFAPTNSAQVTAALEHAESVTGSGWPARSRDRAVMLQAAQSLAAGPLGRMARETDAKGARSPYDVELEKLKAATFCGVSRVV